MENLINKQQYEDDGFLILRNVIDEKTCDKWVNNFDDIQEDKQVKKACLEKQIMVLWNNIQNGHSKHVNISLSDEYMTIMSKALNDHNIKKIVGASSLQLFETIIFKKPSQIGRGFGLHNDCSFFPFDPPDHFSLWISLTDSTEENGPLEILRGSHKLKIDQECSIRDGLKDHTLNLNQVPQLTKEVILIKKGDAVIFDGYSLHSSKENKSGLDRFAISYRFLNGSAKFSKDYPVHKRAAFIRQIKYQKGQMPLQCFPKF